MKARLLAIVGLLAFAMPLGDAVASPDTPVPAEAAWVTMTGLGLPIIADGRVRNHVFVEIRLHLKPGFPLEQARAKDAEMRDAVIRMGHQRSFGEARNWNRIDERALSAALLQMANQKLGRGNVLRVEIVRQTPRMRVRNPV